jgi:hypothetical protein
MTVALPAVELATPPEPFAPVELATTCDRTDKAGVIAFRDFILTHVGGGDFGIDRPCDIGKASEHPERRAWDWKLFADDAAIFRRLGLMYLIWDGQIWSTTYKEWRAYTGASEHRDHIHFSFSWPGALAQTSFFTWLRGGQAPGPVPATKPAMPAWAALLALSAGAMIGYWGLRRLARR